MARDQARRCPFCGGEATRFLFATFVCGSEECVERARLERGGPGGHRNQLRYKPR